MGKFGFNLTYSGIEFNKNCKMAHLICPFSVKSERKFICEQKRPTRDPLNSCWLLQETGALPCPSVD